MKPFKAKTICAFARYAIAYFLITSATLQLHAQCASGLKITSYSIFLNGTGNNGWGFSIPQFDPSVGTLVAVDIRSVVSVNMNFQLASFDTLQNNYIVLAGRNDNISVSALNSPISNAVSQDYGPYSLQPGQDTVGAGTVASPKFFPLMSNYAINDSIVSAVAGFLGTGYVSFSYSPYTYASVIAGSNFSLNTTASDTMRISLTYYYCTSNILADDITAFSVIKESGTLAKIDWATTNEIAGRTYEIQKSSDGKMFNDVASEASVVNGSGTSDYDYGYAIAAGTTGVLYFRLKETNADGQTKYSDIRSIEIVNADGIYLYPNPANQFINIVFNEPAAGGWQPGAKKLFHK